MFAEWVIWESIRNARKQNSGDPDDAWLIFVAMLVTFVFVLPVLAAGLVYQHVREVTGSRLDAFAAALVVVTVAWLLYVFLGLLAVWGWLFVVGVWWAWARYNL